MRRRQFVAGLAGASVWAQVARAQQPDRMRRIGVLMPGDENDPLRKARLTALTQTLPDLGWTDGRNVWVDVRWYGADINRIGALAQELVGLQPDIILVSSTPATAALQRETRTIPIVFANVGDPVATGIVARLDRPSGNITGIAAFEASLGGKWLELLSEIAPGLPFIAMQRSKRPLSPLGVRREAALSSIRIYSRPRAARQSYWRRPETAYRRSIRYLTMPETGGCSPTDQTR
jgi:putative tryptophan/tyrosine transport system substrate-binding protein